MKLSPKAQSRLNRQKRIRKKIRGTGDRPRLCVFRSARYIYAQIIDDETGTTLCASSSKEKALASSLKGTGNVAAAMAVGKAIAEKAKSKKLNTVVFDRNGFIYRGKIKAMADAAREAGLDF